MKPKRADLIVWMIVLTWFIGPASLAQNSASTGAKIQSKLSRSQDIKGNLRFLQIFESLGKAYRVMDGLIPSFGLGPWIDYFEKNSVALDKLTFKGLRVEKNKLFFSQTKKPILFLPDQVLSYKGVKFEFRRSETPKQNMARLQKVWGIFSELGHRSAVKTSLLSLLVKEASADESKLPADEDFISGILGPILRLFMEQPIDIDVIPEQEIKDLLSMNPILICDSRGKKEPKVISDKHVPIGISLSSFNFLYGSEENTKRELLEICKYSEKRVQNWNTKFPEMLSLILKGEQPLDEARRRDLLYPVYSGTAK